MSVQKREKEDLPPGGWCILIELFSVVGPELLPDSTLCPNEAESGPIWEETPYSPYLLAPL